MFSKKRILTLLVTSALVAACGGGSGGGGAGDGGTGGGGGGGGGGGTIPNNDTKLKGFLELGSADQLIFNDRLQNRSEFEVGGIFGQPGGDANAPAAPLQSFGFRVDTIVKGNDGEDTALGRIAIELTEDPSTAEGNAESMKFLIDGVRLTVNADNTFTAQLEPGAKMYVNGVDATGTARNATVSGLPANTIKTMTIEELDPDGAAAAGGDPDPTNRGLVLDINTAFASADQAARDALSTFADMNGRFDMTVAFSPADIRTPGGQTVLMEREITVPESNQAAVRGSGVKGILWVRRNERQ